MALLTITFRHDYPACKSPGHECYHRQDVHTIQPWPDHLL